MNDAQLLLQTYVLIDVETVKVCFKMFSQGHLWIKILIGGVVNA